ncbi:tubby-like F-box protein 5-like, partial [Trifolium medium]|nr:tubby-like F-box protein 5-like [Trifolium medium]
ATVSYRLNVLRASGPRQIQCTLHLIPTSSIKEGGTALKVATVSSEAFGSTNGILRSFWKLLVAGAAFGSTSFFD